MIQAGYLIELNPEDPVDKAVQNLINLGLIEGAYNAESGELGVILTEKVNKVLTAEELEECNDDDDFQRVLNVAKKILDKVRQGVVV